MGHFWSKGVVALLLASACVSGCSKQATGQVVAVVNGEEITLQELNAELSQLNLPANVDKKAVQSRVLQQMVDRRLLAQAAKEAGLDRDAEYLIQQRRMNEQLLVSMYGKKAFDTVRVPDTATVDKYIAENPMFFSGRTKYMLDQLVFPMPSDLSVLKGLQGTKTLGQVQDQLKSRNIAFDMKKAEMDSAQVPSAAMKQILALPPGEPFIVPAGNVVTVSVITGSTPIAVPTEEARAAAARMIRSNSLDKIGMDRLKEAKAKAKIEYQPGYSAAPEKK
ncbi:EpsD family peptidyl-prolyl cis-trans isomerase [Sphingobium subterraneum]|uniref:peptidylprolyl isomerase n=1 Tax=Sphingobium subterraneum TaxID=627688 RepID=A0A841J4T5_9SPHN|nr:EpsD family peptidyl-prolyl cis-trans isomerase [Sphingobium subterraneum]MBB6123251.1 EpsD family peptidyl-prolyl cis-trans isomerase [Sphingobium subterraneum]